MFKIYRFFIIFTLSFIFWLTAAAESSGGDILPYFDKNTFLSAETASDLENIKNKKLRLGVFSPYDYTEKNGVKTGNAEDFRELLERVFGFSVSITELLGEEEAAEALENGHVDMVFGLRKSSEDGSGFYFSQPVFTRKLYIFSSERQAKNLRKNNIKALQKRNVISYKGLGIKDNFTRNLNIEINLIKCDSIADIIAGVNGDNSIDFAIIPGDAVFDPEIAKIQNRIAEAKDVEDSSGLLAVKDEKLAPLLNAVEEYYGKTGKRPFGMLTEENTKALYSLIFTYLNNLTEQEREFLKNTEGLKVYISNPVYPLVYSDKPGKFAGIYVDMVDKFAELSKMPVTYHLISKEETENKKKTLKENEILLNFFLDNKNRPFLSNFNGYYNTALTIYGRNNSNKYWRDSDRVGSVRNSHSGNYLEQIGIDYKRYSNGAELFKGLKNGEIDFAAAPAQSYYGQILRGSYWVTKIESTPVTLWPDMFVYKTGSPVAGLFDKAFNGFIDYNKIMDNWAYRTDETAAEIISKYFISVRKEAKQQIIFAGVTAALVLLAAVLYIAMRTRSSKNKALIMIAAAEKNANKAKSGFLSNMSHEIRTPLNVILGLSQIAIKNNDGPGAIEALKHIEESGRHLLAIVNDVLDMSKIEAGKYEIAVSVFDLKETLGIIDTMITVKAREKRQDFKIDVAPGVPRYVEGDGKSVRQVLINLLSNAVKFTPENGKVAMNVALKKETDEKTVVSFTVEDNGIGMTEQQAGRVFSPFEQGDAQISRSFGGTGLGLSISKHLAELMGGGISMETEQGKGSKFIFTVSFRKPSVIQEEKHETPDGGAKNCRLNIMVVDDVDINRIIIANMLEGMNPEITEASNGRTALELYEKSEEGYYDIILMDIHMPEMNGYDAAKAIRSSGRKDSGSVAILAITASAFKEDIEAAKAAGMDGHVSKPINMGDLISAINRLAEENRLACKK